MSVDQKKLIPRKNGKTGISSAIAEEEVAAALRRMCQDRGHHEYETVLICRHCRALAEMPKQARAANRKQRRRKR